MNHHVNAISGRLSLRPPQRESLERSHRVMEIAHPKHGQDMSDALEVIGSEFPAVTNFERAFPSLCFALATGVGKTRLMGAFISYLHLEHGICNFFVLAPNLTIYNKLIADFTENTPKYVFKGIHAFAAEPPQVITGDNYEQRDPRSGRLFGQVQINIFNVAKISASGSIATEKRLEDYPVRGLIDFDDISYDDHAELLYDLAIQVVSHLSGYLDEDDTRNVLQYYERQLVDLIHTQMQTHQWEGETDWEVKVSKGFTELKQSAFMASEGAVRDFRQTVDDKSKIGQYVFEGFAKSLYAVTKFDSDSERLFSVVLENDPDVEKWFRPAKGQFQLFYKSGVDSKEYQRDFVAETAAAIYMCEPKMRKEIADPEVLAKKEAAELWCKRASAHTASYGGKAWKYALIPHDAIAANMSLTSLARLDDLAV